MKAISTLLILLLTWLPWRVAAQFSPYFYEHQRLDASIGTLKLIPKGRFGSGVTVIGDLDQDGVSEWLVMSHSSDSAICYVIYPDQAGNVLKVIPQAPPLWQGVAATSGGRIGFSFAAAGDIDGDGNFELWVGEPGGKEGPLAYGAVWLWSVDREGKLSAKGRWGGRSEVFLKQLSLDGSLGVSLAVLGPDLIAVSAPIIAGKGIGKIFLLRHDRGSQLRMQSVIGGSGEWYSSLKINDYFGASICSPGDLDGDGGADLLVSAPEDGTAGLRKGALHLFSLDASGQIVQHRKLNPGDQGLRLPLDADDRWGSAMTVVSPLADSTALLAVAALKDDDGGKDQGAIYYLTLHRRGEVIAWHKVSGTTYNFEGELGRFYHGFGYSLAAAGDHNQDGRPDLLVGGPGDADDVGATWLLLPSAWPERLLDTARWLGSFQLTATDSARIFSQARSAKDSARIDSMYNLESYALNHLVFVLDVSASMSKPDRLPLLREALLDLLPYMRPEDKLTVITYSGKAEVHLEAVEASSRDVITTTFENLRSSGETKPGKALQSALDLALRHYVPGGNNRIIFGTDGGFDQDEIGKQLSAIAASEVTMSVFYFGKLPESRILEMRQISMQTGGNAAHITGQSARGALLRESKVIGKRVP